MRRFFTVLVLTLFSAGASSADSSVKASSSVFKNSQSLKNIYKFNKLYSATAKKSLRVAVLDKGFDGYAAEIGKTLPAETQYIQGPIEAPAELKVEHGLRMAQILTDLATNSGQRPDAIAELRLYNVYGFSNFQAAIEDLIENQVDLVLYSEVWEFGNNFDGKGFINAEVQKALEAGVVWVNAAGNFGQTTYNGEIKAGADNWLRLPDQNQSLSVRCLENTEKKCQIRVVLSWNDFKDDSETGTDKDLDLALTDDLLNIIQTSHLKQSAAEKILPGESKYPRETVVAEVPVGQYFIRVKQSSQNFTSKDRLRIAVDGDNLSVASAQKGESLLNPADLKGVIAVGAWDSPRTGISVRLKKPDIWALSSLIFTDGREFRGSSNSAAIVAAALVLQKSVTPDLASAALLKKVSVANSWQARGLSLNQLMFTPAAGACFTEVAVSNLPEHIQALLARGAKLVETNYGKRLMTPFDPAELKPGLRRTNFNDLILAGVAGLTVAPRLSATSSDQIEIFQRPQEAGPCDLLQTEVRHLGF